MSSNIRHATLVQQLRQRLQQMGRGSPHSAGEKVHFSSGVAAIDALLPSGILRVGMIVEWITERAGSGAARLALLMALKSLQSGGALVVIDGRKEFYPPAAMRLGLDLARTIVVRPRNSQEAIWALEQALGCGGVAAALGWIDKISDRAFRRLQLAVEQGAGLGVLMRPAAARHEPTWADLRWWVQPVAKNGDAKNGDASSGRRLQIELLHCRGGTGGRAIELEISDETGDVRMAPPLAAAANLSRAARA